MTSRQDFLHALVDESTATSDRLARADYSDCKAREDAARYLFSKYDRDGSGTIEAEEIVRLFMDCNFLPVFGKQLPLIVKMELENAGLQAKKLNFSSFITLYNRLRDYELQESRVVDYNGKTLEDCCLDGDAKTLVALIELGADLNGRDSLGNLPIVLTAARGYLGMCDLLLQAGADSYLLRSERAALLDAVQSRSAHKTRQMIEKLYGRKQYERALLSIQCLDGAVEAAAETRRTDTHMQRSFGNWKKAPDFVGARPAHMGRKKLKIKKKKGHVPGELLLGLHEAAVAGDLDGVKKWLNRGADLNGVDENFNTALMHAAWLGDVEVVKYLLASGAKLLHANIRGNTVMHFCAECNNKECNALLRSQKKAHKIIDDKNNLGFTADDVASHNKKLAAPRDAMSWAS